MAPSPSPSCEMNGTITRNPQLHGVLRPMTHPKIKPQEFPQSQRCLRSAGPPLGRPRAPRCPSALGPRGPEAAWAGSARGSPERGDERPPAASRLCPMFFVREGERVAVPRHPCHRHFCGHAPCGRRSAGRGRAGRAPLSPAPPTGAPRSVLISFCRAPAVPCQALHVCYPSGIVGDRGAPRLRRRTWRAGKGRARGPGLSRPAWMEE